MGRLIGRLGHVLRHGTYEVSKEGFEDRSIAKVSLKTLSCAGDEAEADGPKPCVQDCPASQSSPSDLRSFGVSPHAPLPRAPEAQNLLVPKPA